MPPKSKKRNEQPREDRLVVQQRRKGMQQAMLAAAIEFDETNVATTLFRYLHSMAKRKMQLHIVRWDSFEVGGYPMRELHFFVGQGMEWIVPATDNDHASIRRWMKKKRPPSGAGFLDYAFTKNGLDCYIYGAALYLVATAYLFPGPSSALPEILRPFSAESLRESEGSKACTIRGPGNVPLPASDVYESLRAERCRYVCAQIFSPDDGCRPVSLCLPAGEDCLAC